MNHFFLVPKESSMNATLNMANEKTLVIEFYFQRERQREKGKKTKELSESSFLRSKNKIFINQDS